MDRLCRTHQRPLWVVPSRSPQFRELAGASGRFGARSSRCQFAAPTNSMRLGSARTRRPDYLSESSQTSIWKRDFSSNASLA